MTRAKEGYKNVLQRIPVGLLERIDDCADRSGVSRTAVINIALTDYVNNAGDWKEPEAAPEAPAAPSPAIPSAPAAPSPSAVEVRTLETLGALVDAVNRLNVTTAERERQDRIREGARDYMTFISHAPAFNAMNAAPSQSSCRPSNG